MRPTRLTAALVAGAAAASAAASIATEAPASRERAQGGVRFVLQYRGSFEGSWRITDKRNDISGYKCGGSDTWGTFRTSVRPGSRPLTVVVATDLDGRSVYLGWSPGSGRVKGVVDSARTAGGWMLDYQKGDCVQVPLTDAVANCGARSFSGQVGLELDSKLTRGTKRAFLGWELEPASAGVGCPTGQMWGLGVPGEEARATLDLQKLYRCGSRKPRGCRFTIRGSHTHAHSTTQPSADGAHIDVGNGRIRWSVTFVARGRA
jgi:hypothetical protein